MDYGKFEELCNREITKRTMWEEAREVVRGLKNAESKTVGALKAHDAALKERDLVMAEIADRKAKDVKAAEKERGDLKAMLARDQAAADKDLAAAKAELAKVQAQIDKARTLATLAEEQRDGIVAEAERVSAAAIKSRDALVAEEAAVRQRLAAALGR